jgi:hypothetical protein
MCYVLVCMLKIVTIMTLVCLPADLYIVVITAIHAVQLGITSEPHRLDQSLACMQRAQELHPTSVEVLSDIIHSNTIISSLCSCYVHALMQQAAVLECLHQQQQYTHYKYTILLSTNYRDDTVRPQLTVYSIALCWTTCARSHVHAV